MTNGNHEAVRAEWFRAKVAVAVVATLATSLTACESARMVAAEPATVNRVSVYRPAPLSLPPDYGMRPKPSESKAEQPARGADVPGREALAGRPNLAPNPDLSRGTVALLRETGAATASPEIRSIIAGEMTILVDESSRFVDMLIFWPDDKTWPDRMMASDTSRIRLERGEESLF